MDDFFGGHPSKDTAFAQLQTFIDICGVLGVTLKIPKIQIPNQFVRLLGWWHNTSNQSFKIPDDKFPIFIALIDEFLVPRAKPKFLKYRSLYGTLRWGATAVQGGVSLLIDLHYHMYKQPLRDHDHLRMTEHLQMLLRIWRITFSSLHKGISYSWFLRLDKPALIIYVDSSSSGLGGCNSEGQWFQYNYSEKISKRISERKKLNLDIQWGEMLAVIVAVHLWNYNMKGKLIRIYTDNTAVQWNIRKWNTPCHRTDKILLLKQLSLDIVPHKIRLDIRRVTTEDNTAADILSRLKDGYTIQQFKETYKTEFGIHPETEPLKCAKFIKQKIKEYKQTETDRKALKKFLLLYSKNIYSLISEL